MKNTTIELTDQLINATPVIQIVNEPNMFVMGMWAILLLAGVFTLAHFIKKRNV